MTMEIERTNQIEIWNEGIRLDSIQDIPDPKGFYLETESIRENLREIFRIIRDSDRMIMTESIPMTIDYRNRSIYIQMGQWGKDIYLRGEDDELIDELINLLRTEFPDLDFSTFLGNLYLSLYSEMG